MLYLKEMKMKKEEIAIGLLIGAVVSTLFVIAAVKLGDVSKKIVELEHVSFGAFSQAGGITYRLRTSIGTTDTSINLVSLKNRSDIPLTMGLLGTDKAYGTLSPQTSRSEFISFTGITQNSNGTAQLTGVTRGLSDIYPYTASTTLQEAHPGQSIFILSDSPQFFEEFTKARNESLISSVWNFYQLPISTSTATSSRQFITKAQLDASVNQGAATSTESNGGIVELATSIEAASSTDLGAEKPLVLQAKNSTSTPDEVTQVNRVPVTNLAGKLHQLFLNLNEGFSWLGSHVFNASTTFSSNAKVTFSASTTHNTASSSVYDVKNGITYAWPTSVATNTVLTSNPNGTLYWINPFSALQTFFPQSLYGTSTVVANIAANTTATCGAWNFPSRMSIASTTIMSASTPGTAGTVDIGIYEINTATLATKVFEVTTGTIAVNRQKYGAVTSPAFSLNPGNYYICVVPNGTANVDLEFFSSGNSGGADNNLNKITDGPVMGGTLTVSAGVLPSTFNPVSLSVSAPMLLQTRFDGP